MKQEPFNHKLVLVSQQPSSTHCKQIHLHFTVSRRKYFNSNQRNSLSRWLILYTKKGSGSPVLLIHDIVPGACGYEWNRIEEELAMEHTVYTIDLLGCGRSEKPGVTYKKIASMYR